MGITDFENRINAKGKAALGRPVTVGVVSTSGVFLDEYQAASMFGVEVESANPLVYVLESDVGTVAQNTTVVISSTTYYVTNTQPDGEGLVLLILSKDQA